MALKARRRGEKVERRRCACGKHLVVAGGMVCKFCVKLVEGSRLKLLPGLGVGL